MKKVICDICGTEMPNEKTGHIENLNFCISSNGKIWDICDKCRVSLNKWMLNIRFGLSLKEGQNEDGDSTDFGSYYAANNMEEEYEIVDLGNGLYEKRKKQYIKIDVAKRIWKIAGLSPEHGNAVMDILGEEVYQKVMRLQKEE